MVFAERESIGPEFHWKTLKLKDELVSIIVHDYINV